MRGEHLNIVCQAKSGYDTVRKQTSIEKQFERAYFSFPQHFWSCPPVKVSQDMTSTQLWKDPLVGFARRCMSSVSVSCLLLETQVFFPRAGTAHQRRPGWAQQVSLTTGSEKQEVSFRGRGDSLLELLLTRSLPTTHARHHTFKSHGYWLMSAATRGTSGFAANTRSLLRSHSCPWRRFWLALHPQGLQRTDSGCQGGVPWSCLQSGCRCWPCGGLGHQRSWSWFIWGFLVKL